jgi:hypothetical protein
MATKAELEVKVKALEGEVLNLESEVSILIEENEKLTAKLGTVKAKTVVEKTVDLSSDYVVLDGKQHKIIKDDTAKEIVEAVKKRFVPEQQTVVVIDREGSNR